MAQGRSQDFAYGGCQKLTGDANQCSTLAFLGRGTDDFKRKFLPRNFYFLIFLSRKFFTSNDFTYM